MNRCDAQDEKAVAEKALADAGIPEDVIKAGTKAIQKAINPSQIGLLYQFMAAEAYLKFVLKRRDYKYIVSTGNAAKPMISVDVNDLDRDENLLNTPEGTFDLKKGLAGGKAHDSKDYITKITTCAPGDKGKQFWDDALKLFFCGDQQLIDYVQMVVGMAAIGKVYQGISSLHMVAEQMVRVPSGIQFSELWATMQGSFLRRHSL